MIIAENTPASRRFLQNDTAVVPGDILCHVSRVSTPCQKHDAYDRVLRHHAKRWGIEIDIVYLTGSARASKVHNSTGYYARLRRELKKRLALTAGRVYVVFPTLTRFARSSRYDDGDVGTWRLSEDDWQLLSEWLFDFGVDADRIRFAFVFDGNPEDDRWYETEIGKNHNRVLPDGRRIDKATSSALRAIVIEQAKSGKSAIEIKWLFDRLLLPAIHIDTIRRWIRESAKGEISRRIDKNGIGQGVEIGGTLDRPNVSTRIAGHARYSGTRGTWKRVKGPWTFPMKRVKSAAYENQIIISDSGNMWSPVESFYGIQVIYEQWRVH